MSLLKHINNDMYIWKMSLIHYTDGHHKNVEYVEGQLILIIILILKIIILILKIIILKIIIINNLWLKQFKI